jgi:hypothetical protein
VLLKLLLPLNEIAQVLEKKKEPVDGHDHRPSSITELKNGDADMASGPGFELDVSMAFLCHSVT